MPGQFSEKVTEFEVVLVYQLVDAIFEISKTDNPRKRVWKYYGKFFNGAKRVRNLIWKMFRTKNVLDMHDISEIFESISHNLQPAYVKPFESSDKDILALKQEFVNRLQTLHSTWNNTHKQP